jgi:hypothetical protein
MSRSASRRLAAAAVLGKALVIVTVLYWTVTIQTR